MTDEALFKELYDGLQGRPEPWRVSQQVVELLKLTERDGSRFPQPPWWYGRYNWGSSMSRDFDKPASMDTARVMLEVARAEWPDINVIGDPRTDDPADVAAALSIVRHLMTMEPGKTSFKTDRLDKRGRQKVDSLRRISRRRYDKLFRLVGRVEADVPRFVSQREVADLTRFAKLGLASQVPWEEFTRSHATAAFVAYYAANLGRRSLFTSGKQARAFDYASEFLLKRLEEDPRASWVAVAHVWPRDDVLARLTPEQRGDLLDRALRIMARTAELMEAAVTPTMDLENLVVRRGDDSSTWNALAGAWNKARDVWLATAASLDETVLEALVPGKALRLMAADVVAWHRSTNGLDPDTKVWQQVPRPWLVMRGEASCTRADIVAACQAAGVDPAKSGWAGPRSRRAVDSVRDTPETVHGVVVSHPQLAKVLRRAGWFSGYESRVRETDAVTVAAGMEARAAHAAAYGPPEAVTEEAK